MLENTKPKIAFIVQRYGSDVVGGAETLCRILAEQMVQYWDIEVLTTCARDYVRRFENDYESGKTAINGVSVRRFAIDHYRSDDHTFSSLDRKVLRRESSADEELLWLKEIGPYSSTLISYVSRHDCEYDLFFFFTYLYATTTLILPLVSSKSFLIPTVHDEPPLHARFFDDFFNLPRAVFFLTEEERQVLQKRAGIDGLKCVVTGVGIHPPQGLSPHVFRREFKMESSFFLYVGRIQKQKGCDELFEFYLSLPESIKKVYPLILVGKSAMEIPKSRYIRHIGFVSEGMKCNALAAASLLIMPSRMESLNMVVLESWLCGTAVLVNGSCDVLREHCRRSNGGLWYTDFHEFEQCIRLMAGNRVLSSALANNGKKYVLNNYNWGVVTDQYLEVIRGFLNGSRQ